MNILHSVLQFLYAATRARSCIKLSWHWELIEHITIQTVLNMSSRGRRPSANSNTWEDRTQETVKCVGGRGSAASNTRELSYGKDIVTPKPTVGAKRFIF